MLNNSSLWSLTRALIWRTIREQGIRLWLFPCLVVSLFLGSIALVILEPSLLTGLTSRALIQVARDHFSADINTSTGMAMVLLLLQGPYFVALIGALMASSFACAAVGTETSRGGLEIMLSAPLQPRDIFLALITHITVLSAVSWVLLIGVILILAIGTLHLLEPQMVFSFGYLLSATLMPLSVILWASLIAVSLSIYCPKLADIHTGTTNNLVQLIAILPAFLLFMAVNLSPRVEPLYVVIAAFGMGLVGSVLTAFFLIRGYKPELFLQNV